MNISNSNELQAIIMERNQQQLASGDALFGDAPPKKKRKITLGDDDLHGYVTLSHQSIKGLIVKKAGKSREDIHIPLVSDQLKLLFDYLTSEGLIALQVVVQSIGEIMRKLANSGPRVPKLQHLMMMLMRPMLVILMKSELCIHITFFEAPLAH